MRYTVIDRRRLRRSLGSRVIRRQSTKMSGSQFKLGIRERPKTRMKNLIRDIQAGLIEHP